MPSRRDSARIVKVGEYDGPVGNTAEPATYRLSVPNTRQFASVTPRFGLEGSFLGLADAR